MKSLLISAALLLLASAGFSQSTLQFRDKEIILKNLKADDAPTEAVYKYKNTGNQPIIITRVSPMASLLRAEWDKAPVAPGKSGEIKISFNSAQVPPKFDYNIMIFVNNGNREQVRLSANIVDNPAKPELLYRYDMSGLKFKDNNVQYNNIFNDQAASDTLYFFNKRTDSITVGTYYLPQYMQFRAEPKTVAPGKKGMLILTYDAVKKNDYGYFYESVILSLNESKDYKNRLTVTGNIVEDFGKLDKKERTNAPVATFEKKEINFGDIKPGDKADCDFQLKNTGKRDLIIRKTSASCGCTALALGQSTVAPGQSTVIRATFNSTGKSGRQNKSITVITNDPATPSQTLYINGNILNK